MNPWLLLVLVALATHRLTRLAVDDHLPVIAVPRERIRYYFGEFNATGELISGRNLGIVGWSIAYLLGCPWCTSPYIAAALVFGALGDVSIPLPWLWVAAASTFTGLLSGIVESEHELRYKKMEAEIDHLRSRR